MTALHQNDSILVALLFDAGADLEVRDVVGIMRISPSMLSII